MPSVTGALILPFSDRSWVIGDPSLLDDAEDCDDTPEAIETCFAVDRLWFCWISAMMVLRGSSSANSVCK